MNKKKNNRIAAEVIVGGILIICLYLFLTTGDKSSWPARRVDKSTPYREVMGTFAKIVAVAMDEQIAKESLEAAFEQLELVDNLMSDYKSDSQISEVNRDAFNRPVKVSQSTFEVLQKSIEFSRLTDGAFDITVGPLVELYRLSGQNGATPGPEQIAQAKLKVGYEKLELDEQNLTVKFSVDQMKLDLGGIAKGYAIDKAVEAMKQKGAIGGMVDVGGDIRCFGSPPSGSQQWRIGLQDPSDATDFANKDKILLILHLTDAAIATSGDYRRFTLIDDKKYSHIFNRTTGKSADDFSSVTVISENATDADALATALSIMELEKGLALIEQLPNTEAILMPSDIPYPLLKTTGAGKYIK